MKKEEMNLAQAKDYMRTRIRLMRDPNQRANQNFRDAVRADEQYCEAYKVVHTARTITHPRETKISFDEPNTKASRYREEFPIEDYIDNPQGNQKALQWSQETLTKFSEKTTPVEKNQYVSEVGLELLRQPEMLRTALEYWKVREENDMTLKSKDRFSEKVVNVAVMKLGNERYRGEVTETDMAEWVKVYAHSSVAEDAAARLLQAYFKAVAPSADRPKKRTELTKQRQKRVEALYMLGMATIKHLLYDQSAYTKAVNIAFFNDERVLGAKANRAYMEDYMLTKTYSVERSPDGASDRLLQTAWIVQNVFADLSMLTSLNIAELPANNPNVPRPIIDKEIVDIYRAYGITQTEIERRRTLVVAGNTHNIFEQTITSASPLNEGDWNQSFWENHSDPLIKVFNERVRAQVLAKELENRVTSAYRQDGDSAPIFVRMLPLEPDGDVLHIAIPASLLEYRQEIIDATLADYPKKSAAKEKRYAGEILPPGKQRIMTGDFRFRDGFIRYFPIKPTEREAKAIRELHHPLDALQEYGFPMPEIPKGLSLEQATADYVEEVSKKQSVYPDLGGIRVVLKNVSELSRLGYESITFRENPQEKGTMIVDIRTQHQEKPYSVKLDQHLQLNLEDKIIDSTNFLHAVHYTLLDILNQFVCPEISLEERTTNHTLQEGKESWIRDRRLGHLAFLPEYTAPQGRRKLKDFTKPQSDLYLDQQGRDLHTASSERKKRKEAHGRNSTYVGKKGNSLEPSSYTLKKNDLHFKKD